MAGGWMIDWVLDQLISLGDWAINKKYERARRRRR